MTQYRYILATGKQGVVIARTKSAAIELLRASYTEPLPIIHIWAERAL